MFVLLWNPFIAVGLLLTSNSCTKATTTSWLGHYVIVLESSKSLPSVYLPLSRNYHISHGCCVFPSQKSTTCRLCSALVLPVHWVAQARTVSALLRMTDSIDSCWQALKHKHTHKHTATDSPSFTQRLAFQNEEGADHLYEPTVQTIILGHMDGLGGTCGFFYLLSQVSLSLIY